MWVVLALACLAVPITDLNEKPQVAGSTLTVHLVPHTHDDVGWLKTIDQYFAGKNESIQQASVNMILTSVMDALARNPDRKFIYVEMAFFWRWWNQQSETRKSQVKSFVSNGQLEFINGGWCMHDEAAPHFQNMIDQTTEGHTFLKSTFGVAPTVQWQIDPFGHSSANAELSYQMGMESLFFWRADYADRDSRTQQRNMEMLWKPSKSLKNIEMFTSIFFGSYGPPDGFCWDVYCEDEPIQDDIRLEDYNVPSRVQDFIKYALEHASHYRTNNILVPMGSDFQFRNAEDWFANLDKLIRYTNQVTNGTIVLKYSTPSIYAAAVKSQSVNWPVKTDDFFPYGDGPHSYWTGYFTTRPALKRYDRYTMGYSQACRQIESISATANASSVLREALAVEQHHDAVSGTEKQHVANDYAKRVAKGVDVCEQMMAQELAKAAGFPNVEFANCHFLNDSACGYTVGKSSGVVTLIIYNSLSRSRNEVIFVPSSSATGAAVTDSNGQVVTSQVIANTIDTIKLGYLEAGQKATGNFTIAFTATLPALGYATYQLDFSQPSSHISVDSSSDSSDSSSQKSQQQQRKRPASRNVLLENEFVSLMFSAKTGRLVSMTDKTTSATASVDHSFFQYLSSVGDSRDSQPSGAYIFRPNQISADPVSLSVTITDVVNGPLVQEVRQTFNDANITQIVRLYKDSPFVEFEWTVGPIGCHDGWGKEIVSRFTTSIDNDGVFYTDSNGREMQTRVRNHRETWDLEITEPVSQNYYPINTAAYIQDDSVRLTVLTDRSHGGSSLEDGQLEVMVHRRTVQDDSRGVDEPVAEPGVDGQGLIVRGKHWVTFTSIARSPSLHKPLLLRLTYSPIVFFSTTSTSETITSPTRVPPVSVRGDSIVALQRSHLNNPLDENVHLLTKQTLNANRSQFLIRLNNIYEISETTTSSTVTLLDIFTSIEHVDEVKLSANQPYQHPLGPPTPANNFELTLAPMEIRTFLVSV